MSTATDMSIADAKIVIITEHYVVKQCKVATRWRDIFYSCVYN
jgi:hypothetical protein